MIQESHKYGATASGGVARIYINEEEEEEELFTASYQ